MKNNIAHSTRLVRDRSAGDGSKAQELATAHPRQHFLFNDRKACNMRRFAVTSKRGWCALERVRES